MTSPTLGHRVEMLEAEAFRRARLGDSMIQHTEQIGSLSQDLRGVAFDVREIKTELVGHGERLTAIEGRLDRIEADVAGIKTELAEIRGFMERLTAKLLA